MSPESHQRVRQIFQEAVDRPEADWPAFLGSACGDDEGLRRTVERLLHARSRSESFLQSDPRQIERVGRYLVRGELGRGATGVVFEAIDPMIGRSIALKVIHLGAWTKPGQLEFMKDRLFKEASSAGQLFHPGIVIVLDVGQQGDLAFIAMEKVEGPSLQAVLASDRSLSSDEVFRILRQTAAALDYAHKNGVVHRDIKPGNIILHHGVEVKVADFGIAKVTSSEQPTETGVIMGTPDYMSPEQLESQPVDGRSDQFSLAVVAFELLTSGRPFRSGTLATLAHEIVNGPRPSVRKAKPELSLNVDRVLQRALSRYPQARFDSCSEFVEALSAACRESLPVQAATANSGTSRTARRKSVVLVASATAILALGFAVYRFRRETPAATRPSSSVSLAISSPAAAKHDAGSTPGAPKVNQFHASPLSIERGASATLSWNVSGADDVTIDQGIGKVSNTGALAVHPSRSTSYMLTATSRGGITRASAPLSVHPDSDPAFTLAQKLYNSGQEKRRDAELIEAARIFRQAADLGHAGAMAELGEMYRDGDGVARDYASALQWLLRAADAGSVSAMNALGTMYALGEGVQTNNENAVSWFQKAADHKSASGLYNLGGMYERGSGVTRNLDRAMQLYGQAALLGNSEALRRLTQPTKGK